MDEGETKTLCFDMTFEVSPTSGITVQNLLGDHCFKFFFENLQTTLYWVEAGAGFWSGGASANVLEECDGEEWVNCLFSFLLDGFVVTVYTCDVLRCSEWFLMNLQAFGPAWD